MTYNGVQRLDLPKQANPYIIGGDTRDLGLLNRAFAFLRAEDRAYLILMMCLPSRGEDETDVPRPLQAVRLGKSLNLNAEGCNARERDQALIFDLRWRGLRTLITPSGMSSVATADAVISHPAITAIALHGRAASTAPSGADLVVHGAPDGKPRVGSGVIGIGQRTDTKTDKPLITVLDLASRAIVTITSKGASAKRLPSPWERVGA